VVISLLVFAILFTLKGVPISVAGRNSPNDQPGSNNVAPDELPTELTLPNEIFNHLAPALGALGFTAQQTVDSTRWGKTYHYSEAERSTHRISLIKLDPNFFQFGAAWSQKRWLDYAVSIFRTSPSQLVVLSDTTMICEEAHYEVDDVKKNRNVDVVFLTKIILDTIRGSSLEDNVENLRLHLRLA